MDALTGVISFDSTDFVLIDQMLFIVEGVHACERDAFLIHAHYDFEYLNPPFTLDLQFSVEEEDSILHLQFKGVIIRVVFFGLHCLSKLTEHPLEGAA